MQKTVCSLLAAAVAAWPLATAHAQATKPVAKPTAKPVARPAARPATSPPSRPAPAPAPKPAAAPVARPAGPPPAPAPARPVAKAAASGGPFVAGDNVLNLGIGLGNRYGYGAAFYGGSSSVSPALSLSYERGVVPLGPGVLGIGGFVGYQGASYDFGTGSKFKYTDIVVMVRGAWHYPVTPQFDAYGGLGLGLRHTGETYDGTSYTPSSYTDFASGLFVGGRYYFSESFGGFAEVGYDQTFLKIGLSAKF